METPDRKIPNWVQAMVILDMIQDPDQDHSTWTNRLSQDVKTLLRHLLTVHETRMQPWIRLVAEQVAAHAAHCQDDRPYDERQLRDLLEKGLDVLSNRELALLATSRTKLRQLRGAIFGEPPSPWEPIAWFDALASAGEAVTGSGGEGPPDFAALHCRIAHALRVDSAAPIASPEETGGPPPNPELAGWPTTYPNDHWHTPEHAGSARTSYRPCAARRTVRDDDHFGRGLTIVLPAHHDLAVLARTVRSIAASRLDRPWQLIVIALEQSAAAVRGVLAATFGPFTDWDVVASPESPKIHPLNVGDAAARHDLRAYLNPDTVLSDNALSAVCNAFDDPKIHLAMPRAQYVHSSRNPLLAAYYSLWRSLPYVRNEAGGFYCIDQTLRARFDRFPWKSDNQFIYDLTKGYERKIVDACFATITLPDNFLMLLREKTNWTLGNLELAAAVPELTAHNATKYGHALIHVAKRPWHWLNFLVLVGVFVYCHWRARKRLAESLAKWQVDDSTKPSLSPSARAFLTAAS